MNVKKLVLTNLPYVLIGLVCTNLGEAWLTEPTPRRRF